MDNKEEKCEGSCCPKCKLTKNHVIWILGVLLIISTVSAISLAYCRNGDGWRGGYHTRGSMMDGRFDNDDNYRRRGINQDNQVAPGQPEAKRAPDAVPVGGSPVDIVGATPTAPTVTE